MKVYPGKRYYGGCEHMNFWKFSNWKSKRIVWLWIANVQYTLVQANGAVYLATKTGDTTHTMSLNSIGHLTHKPSLLNQVNGLTLYIMKLIRKLVQLIMMVSKTCYENKLAYYRWWSAYSRVIDFKI